MCPACSSLLCLREARAYRGPSLYAYRRVLRLTLDFGTLEDYPTTRLEGFSERWCNGWEHTCSHDEPGAIPEPVRGFSSKPRKAAWTAHAGQERRHRSRTTNGARFQTASEPIYLNLEAAFHPPCRIRGSRLCDSIN